MMDMYDKYADIANKYIDKLEAVDYEIDQLHSKVDKKMTIETLKPILLSLAEKQTLKIGLEKKHRGLAGRGPGRPKLPPLLGAVPRGALPTLASRHLGRVTADQSGLDNQTLDLLADGCAQYIDMKSLLDLASVSEDPCDSAAAAGTADTGTTPGVVLARRVRLGVARDEAFHFYYPDNLESLCRGGAELAAFSPLNDAALPEDLDGLYFGGGYPEVHAARLAANGPMLDAVRRFAASGRPVYAECGGLMYLGRALRTLDGARHELAGTLPVETTMLKTLKTLGYAEVTFAADSLWGAAGEGCRGHEFHYSEIVADGGRAEGWQAAYHLRHRRTEAIAAEGFAKGGVLASYVHLHWASRPRAVESLSGPLRGIRMNDALGPTGILMISHGSPRAEANQRFVALVGRIAARLGTADVLPTFFSIVRPNIPDRVAELAARGVKRIVLLPYFLYTGQHVTHDIPELLEQCRRQFPAIVRGSAADLGERPGLGGPGGRAADPAGRPGAALPAQGPQIEQRSHEIIARQLDAAGLADVAGRAIVARIIHATADFSFARSLRIHPDAVACGRAAPGSGPAGPLRCEDAASGDYQGPQ